MKNSDVWAEKLGEDVTRPDDFRNPYQRDFARLVHSAAFRRLQGKTQVLGLGDSDFYRTRLTHSMEVAQVASGIRGMLFLNVSKKKNAKKWFADFGGPSKIVSCLPPIPLISSIGLAPDLGHPPFGHGGEVALNYCMLNYGGFEGNGQTLRILSRLEKYHSEFGLNPTRRLLFGILKYPLPYSQVKKTAPETCKNQKVDNDTWLIAKKDYIPPKCYLDSEKAIVQWILEPFGDDDRCRLCGLDPLTHEPLPIEGKPQYYHGLDTSIMELADDICYAVHDLEDAIALKLILKKDFDTIMKKHDPQGSVYNITSRAFSREKKNGGSESSLRNLQENLFSENTYERKFAVGGLVHMFISHCTLKRVEGFWHPLLALNATMEPPYAAYLDVLKKVFRELVIDSPSVQQLEFKGQRIVIELFKIFNADPERFLPQSTLELYKNAKESLDKKRVLCDYISGMTDEYAGKLYERFLLPRHGSVFDRL